MDSTNINGSLSHWPLFFVSKSYIPCFVRFRDLKLRFKVDFPCRGICKYCTPMANITKNQTVEVEVRLKLVAPLDNFFYLTKGSISIRSKVSEST